jgi:hypothetical protein
VLSHLEQADRITLVMDPGAKQQGIQLARRLGIQRCWLLVPPMKIDDGIIASDMEAWQVRRLLASADRLSAFVSGTYMLESN